MSVDYDIVIVGAGLIGASLARALAKLPLKIAVIENRPATLSAKQRSLALSYGSALILQQMGIWENVATHATPLQQIHVSDRGHFGFTRLQANHLDLPALGYVINESHLQQALTLTNQAPIHVLQPTTLINLQRLQQRWHLTLDNHTSLTAALVVGADGSHSTVRQLQGITSQKKDYQQSAIVVQITVTHPQAFTAYERLTESGSIALLPLGKANYAMICCLPTTLATTWNSFTDQELLQALQTAFGYRLGCFKQLIQRGLYPLMQQFVTEQIRQGLVLIGNAAHTLHPVAGQGFNLGLRDVAHLAALMQQAIKNKRNFYDFALLQKYLQARTSDQQYMLNFTNSLLTLFKHPLEPLTFLRNLGLLAIDHSIALQKLLCQPALGIMPTEAAYV